MPKKLIIIIILIIFVGIIIFLKNNYFYDYYKMPNDAYIELNDNKFVVYDDINSIDLIKKTNAKIIDEKIETNQIGKQIYTLNYEFQKKKYKYDIEIEIIDNISPIFISFKDNLTVLVNDNESLCNKISYADNYDNHPQCKVLGEYNVSRIGKYNLEYLLTDKYSNEIKKSFTLNVVEKLENTKTSIKPNYVYINDVLKNYKTNNTMIGIDISKWQGQIDFAKVQQAGIEFVIIRIGIQSDNNLDFSIDPKFEEYYKEAKKNNLKIGVYVYNTAISKEDGKKTALFVFNTLNGRKVDFPIGYDFENWTNFQKYQLSLNTLSESYLEFEKTLNKMGYDTMLYSSKFYLENVWKKYDNTNVWLAHYTNKTTYSKDYLMWQMTSLGKVDGINENTVDIDIYYKKSSN